MLPPQKGITVKKKKQNDSCEITPTAAHPYTFGGGKSGTGVSKEVFWGLIAYVVFAFVILYFRNATNYRTPDEVFFLNYHSQMATKEMSLFQGGHGYIKFQYYVMLNVFNWLHQYGVIAIYLFNILLISFAYALSYKTFFKESPRLCKVWWTAMFLMPNMVFFSVSVLRDVQIMAVVVLFLVFYAKQNFGVKMALCLAVIWSLRPELGTTMAVSMGIAMVRKPSWRRLAVLGYLATAIALILFLYYKLEWYDRRIYTYFSLGHDAYGILGFEESDISVPLLLITNALLFYFPLTTDFFLTSRLGNTFILPALVNLYIWGCILFKHGLSVCGRDRLANFAALNLIILIPVTAHENDASSAMRHVVYMLPFLFLYYVRRIRAAHAKQYAGNQWERVRATESDKTQGAIPSPADTTPAILQSGDVHSVSASRT